MNDYLIKNHRNQMLLNFSLTIVFGVIYYFLSESFDWFIVIIITAFIIYAAIKRRIILNIFINGENISIESYSFFKGRKRLELSINKILELGFYDNEINLKYKSGGVKFEEGYEITAEPWNTIYGQIKKLKLKIQELEKEK